VKLTPQAAAHPNVLAPPQLKSCAVNLVINNLFLCSVKSFGSSPSGRAFSYSLFLGHHSFLRLLIAFEKIGNRAKGVRLASGEVLGI
jgi:hypothetical protein